jgi:hypothetical protein
LICNKQFASLQSLKRHTPRHLIDDSFKVKKKTKYIPVKKTYTCSSCDLQFDKWSLLQQHNKSVHLSCEICNRSFKRRDALKLHLETHDTNREIIKCSYQLCDREFKSFKSMKVHINSFHLNVRPFECSICSDSFAYKHILDRHISTHLNHDPKKRKDTRPIADIFQSLTGFEHPRTIGKIACQFEKCEFRFNRIYDLQRHMKAVHCQEKFSSELTVEIATY